MAKSVKSSKKLSKKTKKSSKIEEKSKKLKKKGSKKDKKEEPVDIQSRMASFYAKNLQKVEDDLNLVSNSIIESERISSGSLCIDWVFGGGFVPNMSSLAGEEQSSKTTTMYHTLAVAHSQLHLPYVGLYDAEGAVSPRYTKRIWKPFGMDVDELLSKEGRKKGFYYFRNQVIEQMFDYLKQSLAKMPDKNYNSVIGSWCYYIPKRNDYWKEYMKVMELKPDKTASSGPFFICPTDNAKPEGFFGVDSFASLLTREEEDREDTDGQSFRNAAEASAFARHLKRVVVDLAEKKVVMLGTNQLGSHVRKVYGHPDDQQYEKGGNALKFYSVARARFFSRSGSAGAKHGPFKADADNSKFGIEDSVEYKGGKDRYAIKEVKNTKNKFGNPGLKTFIRVWVSDGRGNPRGIDPVFDVFKYLTTTNQLVKIKGGYQFKLKDSVGKKRAGKLNSIKAFDFFDFKRLIVAEYIGSKELLSSALKKLGIDFKPNLRESLFLQMKKDETLWTSIKDDFKIDDDEFEDDEDTDYEKL